MAKKRHNESPFKPELVAAITKDLPAFLAKEGYFKPSEPKVEPPKPVFRPLPLPKLEPQPEIRAAERTLPPPIPRGNRRALWYAVGLVMLSILGIWGFNLHTLINSTWGSESSRALVDQSKNDWNSILETIRQNDKIMQKKLDEPRTPAVEPVVNSTSQTELNTALNNLAETIKAQPKP